MYLTISSILFQPELAFRQSCRITAKIDDEMLAYYCNEDIFLLEVRQIEEDLFDITLTELSDTH